MFDKGEVGQNSNRSGNGQNSNRSGNNISKTTLNDNPPINQSTGGDKESNNNEILEDK